jgi:TPR repeat protein
MKALVNPFNWRGIKETAKKDERYVYLLLLFSSNAENQDLYKEIRSNIEVHAKAGDPIAQTNLGYMYQRALGVARDNKQAAEWYTKAANQGYARAQYHLGGMYYAGQMGEFEYEADYQKAVEWYASAALRGDVAAQADLGHMYEHGLGVECNDAEAIKYYKAAALQGNTSAACNLGLMHKEARGVKQNYRKAIRWIKRAAKQENIYAQTELGKIYEKALAGDSNQNMAVKWYTKAAKQGDKDAQNALARIYKERIDLANAIFWFMQSRNKKELLDIFEINHSSLPRYQRKFEAFDILEDKLIKAWQEMVIEKTYTRKNSHVSPHKEAYKELEEIMAKLINWRHKLSTQAGLMMNCLLFRESASINAIKNYQQATKLTLYVNQHTLNHEEYLSIGKENVQLAQEIIHEAENGILYKRVKCILKELKKDFNEASSLAYKEEKLKMELAGKAAYTEEKLSIYQQDKMVEQEKPLEGEVGELKNCLDRLNTELALCNPANHSLNRQNDLSDIENNLAEIFKDKITAIEEQKKMFEKYYTLLIAEIHKGLPDRNQNFRHAAENIYLFSAYS